MCRSDGAVANQGATSLSIRLARARCGGGAAYAVLTADRQCERRCRRTVSPDRYGALTWLYYRVWHARGDVTSLVFPALAAFMVGILDEGLQWLVPARVGELRDIMLNGVSIACGLVFSLGLQPVVGEQWMPDRPGRRALRCSLPRES